jgi:putative heme transporter
MSIRAWLSVFTFALIGVIVYFSRHELLHAFDLLGQVNLWVLALLIPVQMLMYFAGGEMMFSYLRAKKVVDHISPSTQARMALELNFVNHVLPSAGVSGMSYMTWRLGKYNVPAGRTTMAQVVRFATGYASYITLMIIAVIMVTIDGHLNRWIILVSTTLVVFMVALITGSIYLISSPKRMHAFADWFTRTANRSVRKLTRGRKRVVVRVEPVNKFFADMHHDYLELMRDKRLLIKPYLWGLVFTMTDIGVFWVTFWALGQPVNPAPILIAYGVATMAGFIMVTPGGAGAYEAIMVAFLAIAGLDQGTAIAGTVLTRVILLMTTIVFGYMFYQHALIKYGRSKK